MIAVVVPVHNEEALLPRCLASLAAAARDPALNDEQVRIFIVLDACTDGSERIASSQDVEIITSTAKNVGKARALGANRALLEGARWLSFTDGDTEVPVNWLSQQLALDADAVCGTVSIRDWSPHPPIVKRRYLQRYQSKDGHRHIHGANFGVSAAAYRMVGGFPSMKVHEDVAIVRALEKAEASVSWVASPCVVTNSRPVGRLLGGFACYLRQLATRESPTPYPIGGMVVNRQPLKSHALPHLVAVGTANGNGLLDAVEGNLLAGGRASFEPLDPSEVNEVTLVHSKENFFGQCRRP